MKKNRGGKRKQIWQIIIVSVISLFCIGYILRQSFVNAFSQEKIETEKPTTQNEVIIWQKVFEETGKKVLKIWLKNKNSYKYSFDLEDDASLQKFISTKHPLNNPEYTPPDLETINDQYIYNLAPDPRLRKPARIAFEELAKEFYSEFEFKLCLNSAYRSYEDQSQLIKNWCSTNVCALPGSSEHNLWTAVDISLYIWNWNCSALSKNSKYYERITQKWVEYGFNNTYKRWSHEDWITEESWHRDYNWKYFAKILEVNDLTISEYYQIINQ